MITNERQYKITKAHAQRFLDAINAYDIETVISEGTHPKIAQAQLDQMKSEYDIFIDQLNTYDELSSGEFRDFGETTFEELPTLLIKARIARTWTQKELAERLNIKQQQVQRYESELYSSCKYSTLVKTAKVLGLVIKENATLANKPTDLPEKFPFNEAYKRGWFEDFAGSLGKAKHVKEKLIDSFYMNAGSTEQQLALHRKKERAGSIIDEYALSAWQARVMYKAKMQKLHYKFDRKTISKDWFKELAKLSQFNDGPARARDFLLSSGIHFVIERHLKNTHLDGAAIRHSDGFTPIIAFTLRHDRLDNFWFVLFHELAHVHLHFSTDEEIDFFDSDIDNASNDIEKDADEFALNSLIPDQSWASCLARFSQDIDAIRNEAKNLQIHPAILAGRIRKEQNNYMILNEAVGYGDVRRQFGFDNPDLLNN
jgi:HTH-type transcriptional regulator/antitoxin HigA